MRSACPRNPRRFLLSGTLPILVRSLILPLRVIRDTESIPFQERLRWSYWIAPLSLKRGCLDLSRLYASTTLLMTRMANCALRLNRSRSSLCRIVFGVRICLRASSRMLSQKGNLRLSCSCFMVSSKILFSCSLVSSRIWRD